MPLIKIDPPAEGTTVLDYDPMITVYRDVLYVPGGIPEWPVGIYDRGRKLITAAAHFRGSKNVAPMFSPYVITNDIDSLPTVDQKETLFLLGHIPGHYGHFLTVALARLWPIRFERGDGTRFLTIDSDSRDFESFPFMKEIFSQLGICQSDVINFEGPVWIKELVVPSPSFEENNFGHQVFARLCKRIGWSLTNNIPFSPCDKPVYLSKQRLTGGVSRIVNELEFCEVLQNNGFDIVFPEELPLWEQTLLLQQRSVITGSVGSGFHTTLFSGPKKIVGLTHIPSYTENQAIIDKLVGNDSIYLYPWDDIEQLESQNTNFHLCFRLSNPKKTADEFIHMVESHLHAP